MTTKSDPVRAGLAEGLRPADTPADVFRGASLLDLLAQNGFWRVLHAVEHNAEAAEKNLAVQKRIADAAERSADAFETIAALLASITGTGTSYCYGADTSEGKAQSVNFLRTGLGTKHFACDAANAVDDEE